MKLDKKMINEVEEKSMTIMRWSIAGFVVSILLLIGIQVIALFSAVAWAAVGASLLIGLTSFCAYWASKGLNNVIEGEEDDKL